MPREFNLSEEKSVHVQTEGEPVEIGVLVNNSPAFVTEVDDTSHIFEMTTENGRDEATIVIFDDVDKIREKYE